MKEAPYDQTTVEACITTMLQAAKATGANLIEVESAAKAIETACREQIRQNIEKAKQG